ncbi:hypothetical protein CC2G_011640 [Coprinopsis cinerea AmutBmut pab1-1]|nr:hypothetical protein CC2G_011640 [Coprinopsis cinerea AmutBmut pab1-1]
MWTLLRDAHMQQKPGTRFNAYDDLFSIRKREDESLQALMNHAAGRLHPGAGQRADRDGTHSSPSG